MELIPVTTGVSWLSIPEADLSILCGSPSDVMKHLKQKGFVVPQTKQGTYYESGPNAILLSDVSSQKGQFSNMAEFPLLHMIFFQGMGVPDHVNNTGRKPLLIGSESQVKAQMDAIYRGRYGLGTYEEILAAGIPEKMAREYFRIKNYYAFQSIKTPEDSINSCIIQDKAAELAPGIWIERQNINIFKIKKGDQELTVDLNLSSGESYEAAVDLDFHRVEKDYFSIVHLGEGDGWDINKPCMGSLVIFQGKYYLIDAGPFILNNLKSLGISINEIEGIFHTHLHDDHFSGLTSLMYTDHRIQYFSSRLVRESVMKKLSVLLGVPVSNCEKAFDIQDLELGRWNNIKGLMVLPSYSPHPVETNVFLFRTPWEGGFKQYMHLADISSKELLSQMLLEDPERNPQSEQIYHQMIQLMDMPVDLKKVDIGGGMIHGSAEDFQKDDVSKILLSHTNRALTYQEKEIGSSASFGQVDVLIPSNRDYFMKSAYEFLSRYFPGVPEFEKQLILNNEIVLINVGEIIIKKDQQKSSIYLVLSGVVEVIDRDNATSYSLSAGSFVGEETMFKGIGSYYTYRAASYVRALKLSASSCSAFLKRNFDLDRYRKIQEIIYFLKKSDLFGELLATYTQADISRKSSNRKFSAGMEIPFDNSNHFYLIRTGKVRLTLENTPIEEIGQGDFFGEDNFFYQAPLITPKSITEVTALQIPFEAIKDIPIIEWKMQARFDRRIMSFGSHSNGVSPF